MKIRFFLASLLMLSYPFLTFFSVDDDVKCLEGIKQSLDDPDRRLSWTFTNTTVTSICKLTGVSCWSSKENRVISLELVSMRLTGQLPDSLKLCHSLQTLNLSNNALSGRIPRELCTWLPYIVTLDLFGNQLSGPIPTQIIGCKFLNKLILSNNKLSGPIPYELGRLKDFSVTGNHLSGSIPSDLARFPDDSFGGNNLCGPTLGKCGCLTGKTVVIIIVVGVIGASGYLILSLLAWWWFFVRVSRKRRDHGL